MELFAAPTAVTRARGISEPQRHEPDESSPHPETLAKLSATKLIPPRLGDLLKPFVQDRSALLDSIVVTEIDAPGNVAYLTKDALHTLKSIKESKT
jgi:hypothetical protein